MLPLVLAVVPPEAPPAPAMLVLADTPAPVLAEPSLKMPASEA